MAVPQVKVTYFTEVLSSWCLWAEPMWAELKARYAGRVDFDWKTALMRPAAFPASREQCDWAYRRSGGTVMQSPFKLNSGWVEPKRKGGYPAPNLVAEAARDLGLADDSLRLALAHAAMRDGRKIGAMTEAIAVAAETTQLDPAQLRARAESEDIRARADASTAEFYAHQITERPAFVLTDSIGDKAVFSGLVRIEPLAAAIDAMLDDTNAYASHAAHHGSPPAK
jgi:predicted DsbA family dithiol-disulfide isomerase